MTRGELAEWLVEIEQTFPVNEWRVGDIHVWPLIRIKLGFSEFYDLRQVKQAPKEARPASVPIQHGIAKRAVKIVRRASKAARDSFANRRVERRLNCSADIVMLSAAQYRTKVGDVWYNRFMDPLVDAARGKGLKALLLELSYGIDDRVPLYNNDSVVQIESHLRLRADAQGHEGDGRREIHLPGYRDFLAFLSATDTSVALDFLDEAKVAKQCGIIVGAGTVFRRILQRTGAKMAVVTAYYDPFGMAFARACRAVGVPCADIQHGVIDMDHFAYARWSTVPANGYDLLPSAFWVWSDSERDVVEKWANDSAHTVAVAGNLWLKAWHSGRVPAISPSTGAPRDGTSVLVTLQPLPSMANFLPEWFLDALDESPPEWHWMIRLHPAQKDRITEIASMFARRYLHLDYSIDEPTDMPLPAVLERADVHVTYNSTVVLEAEQFGLNTVALSAEAASMYEAQAAKGTLQIARDSETLFTKLRKLAASSDARFPDPAKDISHLLDAHVGGHATAI